MHIQQFVTCLIRRNSTRRSNQVKLKQVNLAETRHVFIQLMIKYYYIKTRQQRQFLIHHPTHLHHHTITSNAITSSSIHRPQEARGTLAWSESARTP